jgi:DNA-binding MarR family transcriptional regulator
VWYGCAAQGVKGIKLLVMARLADFSSDEGVCWPSVATISRQLGAGRSTVITAITQLEADGWLTRTERRNGQRSGTNLYTLNAEKLRTAAAYFQSSDSERSNPERSENANKQGSQGSESGHDPSVTTDPSLKQISSSGNSGESPDGEDSAKKIPAAKKWGTPEDHQCASWIFSRIRTLYEQAAETDGEVARPREPNWNAWANEIRLMRTIDGRTHRQICDMFRRVQSDPFWCRNVLSPAKLREKWDDLVLKLAPVAHSGVMRSSFDDEYYKNDNEVAASAGFRVRPE